tara:strand:- start:205 stop:612 length:408 start_codon:yes stop_codon:yes gene_type:complete
MTVDEFYQKIKNILIHNTKINGDISYIKRFFTIIKKIYNTYKSGAIKRNYDFKITKEFFNDTIAKNCYLCGIPSNDININGIDRYDNNIGYTEENCKPCCSPCNIMKKNYSFKYLINKLVDIYEFKIKNDIIIDV